MKRVLTVVIALLLTACEGQHAEPLRESQPVGIVQEPSVDAIAVTGRRRSPGVEEQDMLDPSTRYLAYEYWAQLQLPAEAVKDMLTAHEEACLQAGPATCRVLESAVQEYSADSVSGELHFSATRDYMTPFREGLGHEAEAADGRVTSMHATVEDLSREIVDTAARLEAKETLRDRLMLLLERDTDDVGDLLRVEGELARVQADIESTRSYLRLLEGRVSMDLMTIEYESIRKPVTPATARPLQDAFNAFFSIIAESLASVITFIAAALPWLIVAIPGLFVLRRFIRSFRQPK